MDRELARIIVKHIINDAYSEVFERGIETMAELDRQIEDITDKVLEKNYKIKFEMLNY